MEWGDRCACKTTQEEEERETDTCVCGCVHHHAAPTGRGPTDSHPLRSFAVLLLSTRTRARLQWGVQGRGPMARRCWETQRPTLSGYARARTPGNTRGEEGGQGATVHTQPEDGKTKHRRGRAQTRTRGATRGAQGHTQGDSMGTGCAHAQAHQALTHRRHTETRAEIAACHCTHTRRHMTTRKHTHSLHTHKHQGTSKHTRTRTHTAHTRDKHAPLPYSTGDVRARTHTHSQGNEGRRPRRRHTRARSIHTLNHRTVTMTHTPKTLRGDGSHSHTRPTQHRCSQGPDITVKPHHKNAHAHTTSHTCQTKAATPYKNDNKRARKKGADT